MKIISKSKVEFKLGDTAIFPGGHNYPKLKPKDPAIRYQLATLKREGILEFGEIIEMDPDDISFVKEAKVAAEKEAKTKEAKEASIRTVAKKEAMKKFVAREKVKAKTRESENKNAQIDAKTADTKTGRNRKK